MDLKFGINKNEGFEKILEEIYKPVSNFKERQYCFFNLTSIYGFQIFKPKMLCIFPI